MADTIGKNSQKIPTILYIIGAFVVGAVIGGLFIQFFGGKKTILRLNNNTTIVEASIADGFVALFPQKAIDVGDNWVIKMDDYAITKTEYEEGWKEAFKLYKEQYNLLPADQKLQVPIPTEESFKKQYLDILLSQYIITIKALTDHSFLDKNAEVLLQYTFRQSLVQMYLQNKMPDQSRFIPSKMEIEQYYSQNRKQFDATKASAAQIREYITKALTQQKFQEWQISFLGQAKEGFKVERNRDYLMGLDNALPQSAPANNTALPVMTNQY